MSDYSIVDADAVEDAYAHRNLGDEPVELWAVSRKIEGAAEKRPERSGRSSAGFPR